MYNILKKNKFVNFLFRNIQLNNMVTIFIDMILNKLIYIFV